MHRVIIGTGYRSTCHIPPLSQTFEIGGELLRLLRSPILFGQPLKLTLHSPHCIQVNASLNLICILDGRRPST